MTKPEVVLNLVDEEGKITTLAAIAKKQNKILITEFIYTRCNSLCLTLGDYFQQAQKQLKLQALSRQIHLLSISFDVNADNVVRLKQYRKRMHAEEDSWSLVTMHSSLDVKAARDQLGLMVLADPYKGFVHNSAFLVISTQGRVMGIYDDNDVQGALMLAVKLSQQPSNDQ